jgi:hypothetical protein
MMPPTLLSAGPFAGSVLVSASLYHHFMFPVVLFTGAFFNGYVMPRRIQRQVADGSVSPKIAGRFCLLWRCWSAIFVGLGVFVLVLTFVRK